MPIEERPQGKLNLLFFATIWVFFSLNSKFLRIPNADIVRWVLLAFLFIKGLQQGRSSFPNYLIVYSIAVIPSLFTSINQPTSIEKFLSFIFFGICMFTYFSSLSDSFSMEDVILSAMWVAIAFEIMSIICIGIGRGFDGNRANGITTNANTFGIYSNLALLSSFYLYQKRRTKWLLVIMVLSVVTAVLSGSRTAFISLLVNILLLIYIRYNGSSGMLAAIGILAIVAGVVASGKIQIEALNRLLAQDDGSGVLGFKRTSYWEAGMYVWRQYPYFGCGYTVSGPLNVVDPGYPFHNSYLSILAETGIWGVVFLLMGTLSNIIRFFGIAMHDLKKNDISVAVIVALMMIELLLAAYSESFLFAVGSTEGCMFWMLFFWSIVYCKNMYYWNQYEEDLLE